MKKNETIFHVKTVPDKKPPVALTSGLSTGTGGLVSSPSTCGKLCE